MDRFRECFAVKTGCLFMFIALPLRPIFSLASAGIVGRIQAAGMAARKRKKMKTKFAAIAAMALSAVTILSGAASAQCPVRPVTFVVPRPEGGSDDVLTGLIAREFTNIFGAQATVVNRPGGPQRPVSGAQEVAAAEPDGYTIGSFPNWQTRDEVRAQIEADIRTLKYLAQ